MLIGINLGDERTMLCFLDDGIFVYHMSQTNPMKRV